MLSSFSILHLFFTLKYFLSETTLCPSPSVRREIWNLLCFDYDLFLFLGIMTIAGAVAATMIAVAVGVVAAVVTETTKTEAAGKKNKYYILD